MRRRTALAAGAVLAGGLWAGHRQLTGGPAPVVPGASPGDERLERRFSSARNETVDFYTAVPAGHGDGRGLPVCFVLHGMSKTPADYAALGFGRFLTGAVLRGAPPFVLAGAAGGRAGWQHRAGVLDDPQRMVHDELAGWCEGRGFDTGRLAAWGWSVGGAGSLLLAEAFPGFVRAVAAFAPAVGPGDAVFEGAALLKGTKVGLWCGRGDDLYDNVRALEKALPAGKAAGGYGDGNHNMGYWTTVIPAAFDFIAAELARSR
jgi:hypothetical protein